jgi:hypothetical protein
MSHYEKSTPAGTDRARQAVSNFRMASFFSNSEPNPDNQLNCSSSAVLQSAMYTQAVFCNNQMTGTQDDDDFARWSSCNQFTNNTHNVFLCHKQCAPRCSYPASSKDAVPCQNIASRMTQTEALGHAQAAFFIAVVICQWGSLLAVKTRWLSVRQQGLTNLPLNISLFFSTIVAAWVCYSSQASYILGTRPLRFTHWFPGLPFGVLLFLYDEARKFVMRATSFEYLDKASGLVRAVHTESRSGGFRQERTYVVMLVGWLRVPQVKRHMGWAERNTYY